MNTSGATFGVAVIGAGFGGIAAGAELIRRGFDRSEDLLVLESAREVGGVWRENVYPDCACDVDAHLYSFSFAPNPEWSTNFAPQAEILAYAEQVASSTGVADRIRFEQQVRRMEWDAERRAWSVHTESGEVFSAEHVISAVGQLNRPAFPRLPGMEDFRGPMVHTAQWDPSLDVTGKRVLVVGAGASAIQVVPWMVPRASQTITLVRTAPYVMPKPQEWYAEEDRARFRSDPGLLAQDRARLNDEWNRSAHAQSVMDEEFLSTAERTWREHMESAVADEELRRILTPDYRFGCRRPVVSNDYYPALADPRTTVIASGAARFTERGVITEDGQEIEVDIVVLATGFLATDILGGIEVRGSDGQLLSQKWQSGPAAYQGTLVPGFPNFYVLYGPNTQVSGSIIGILEAQAEYVVKCIEASRANRAPVDVTEAAFDRYNDELDRALGASVFVQGGCQSFYRMGGSGRVVVKWPGSLERFEQMLAEPSLADLGLEPAEALR